MEDLILIEVILSVGFPKGETIATMNDTLTLTYLFLPGVVDADHYVAPVVRTSSVE